MFRCRYYKYARGLTKFAAKVGDSATLDSFIDHELSQVLNPSPDFTSWTKTKLYQWANKNIDTNLINTKFNELVEMGEEKSTAGTKAFELAVQEITLI